DTATAKTVRRQPRRVQSRRKATSSCALIREYLAQLEVDVQAFVQRVGGCHYGLTAVQPAVGVPRVEFYRRSCPRSCLYGVGRNMAMAIVIVGSVRMAAPPITN